MFVRLVLGAVTAGAMVVPALAGMMNADEARRFVTGKVFAFSCFDGTRGAGRVLDDLGAAGSIQFSGAGPVRHVRLPGNTLQIRGGAVLRYKVLITDPTVPVGPPNTVSAYAGGWLYPVARSGN